MRIDFHIHTSASPDSVVSPRSLAKRAAEYGIVPAITDHFSMASIPLMKESGIDFIAGEELRVATPHGEADLIGLFMNEPIKRSTPFHDALDLLKAQGALSCAPHPFDRFRRGLNDVALLEHVQIIEAFNSHCSASTDAMALEYALKAGKPVSAGSDSHFLFEFGHTYVELELDELEPAKLLRALKKGRITGRRSSRLRRYAHRAAALILKPFI